mmetsp:Transcript_20875/g.68953  ORF Transcript_20875/g.68953 Transcript_20875/m.68953 type:complete len:273 (+) Transcript_20875:1273-2091(+)
MRHAPRGAAGPEPAGRGASRRGRQPSSRAQRRVPPAPAQPHCRLERRCRRTATSPPGRRPVSVALAAVPMLVVAVPVNSVRLAVATVVVVMVTVTGAAELVTVAMATVVVVMLTVAAELVTVAMAAGVAMAWGERRWSSPRQDLGPPPSPPQEPSPPLPPPPQPPPPLLPQHQSAPLPDPPSPHPRLPIQSISIPLWPGPPLPILHPHPHSLPLQLLFSPPTEMCSMTSYPLQMAVDCCTLGTPGRSAATSRSPVGSGAARRRAQLAGTARR